MKSVLVVDDNSEVRELMEEILAGSGYTVAVASNGQTAIEMARVNDYDVVILDMVMPKMRGQDVLSELKRNKPFLKIIVITGFATIENAVEAIKSGASDYVTKPFNVDYFLTVIRRVIEESSFEKEVGELEMDKILMALSNPIRRSVIKVLYRKKTVRFMELNRELSIYDHTKLVFHLRILKDANIISQDINKTYVLTDPGQKVYQSLLILEKYLVSFETPRFM
ncbi:response regulator [Candidatus Magnetomonas plexicatena]|uniref:response regulator n=1 Tax=Candidatus Magnetomonas plexicatena TaxID=2552947 RepID=UPI001103DD23|nr:response regulator [Nitrospirales bacterium LBB_01]